VIPWMALGGTDAINVKMVELLSAKNWQITIICTLATSAEHAVSPDLEFSRPDLQKYTEDIHVLPHFVRTDNYGDYLVHMVHSRGADVIMMSNSFAGYNLLPYLKSHVPHVGIVDYVHMRQLQTKMPAYFDGELIEAGGFPKMSAQFAQYLDASMFVSEDEKMWVAEKHRHFANTYSSGPFFNPALASTAEHKTFAPQRFTVYNGVNPYTDFPLADGETKQEARNKFAIDDDALCVAFVGRMVDQKKPIVALQVLRRLVSDDIPVHLLVVGSGPLLEEMFLFTSDNNLWPYVTFVGSVEHSELVNVISAADALLMPSEMEGLSVSLIEAMATGIVPVVTDVGGQKEIVVDGAGYLVDLDDVSAMTAALNELAHDPQKLKTMSHNARNVVLEKFTDSEMAVGIITAFETAIAHASQTAHLVTPEIRERARGDQTSVAAFLSDSDGELGSFVNRINSFNDVTVHPERRTGTGASGTGASGTGASGTTGGLGTVLSVVIQLEGVQQSQFTTSKQQNFKSTIVLGMAQWITIFVTDVDINLYIDVTRRSPTALQVSFKLQTRTTSDVQSNLRSFLTSTDATGFYKMMNAACGSNCTFVVTGVNLISLGVASSPDGPHGSSSDLSAGAIAGVVVACVVCLLVCGGIIYYMAGSFGRKSADGGGGGGRSSNAVTIYKDKIEDDKDTATEGGGPTIQL